MSLSIDYRRLYSSNFQVPSLSSAEQLYSSVELKVAYNPRGSFSFRDFHHAVQNLPVDAFCPYTDESGSGCSEMDLSSLLNDQLLYSWGEKDIVKTVIILVLCSEVKRRLRDLKGYLGEVIQARCTFKRNLFGPVCSVSCNLSLATRRIRDDFAPCQVQFGSLRSIPHRSIVSSLRVDGEKSRPVFVAFSMNEIRLERTDWYFTTNRFTHQDSQDC
ncbi:hypothetical protein QQ045_021166 [Rhodiola kirilowii]